MSTTPCQKSSYEVGTYPEPIGPQRRELYADFNRIHEARRGEDQATVDQLRRDVPAKLDEFERTEANSSDNPKWRRRTTRAGYYLALGEIALALEYEKDGWEAARSGNVAVDSERVAKQQAISASNIADELNRLKEYKEAVQWARISCQLWKGNPVNHLIFAIACDGAGFYDEAEQLLISLVDFVHGNGPGALRVAIYEDQLADMKSEVALRLVQAIYGT